MINEAGAAQQELQRKPSGVHVKLLNTAQVSFYQAVLKEDIERSSGHSDQVIQAVQMGKAQCWAILSTEPDGRQSYRGCAVTFIKTHDLTGNNYLHIGCLAGDGGISDDDWKLMCDTVHAYGKYQKCTGTLAGSLNPRVIDIAHKCGFHDVELMMQKEM